MKTHEWIELIAMLILMTIVSGCGGEDSAVVAKVAAPAISTPTATPVATATPTPTATPVPTATPTPSPSPTPYAYSGGVGTIASPYQVSNANDVRHINDHLSSYFNLTTSIDFEYEPALAPMGAFSGVLYGNNYEFVKLKITGTSEVKAALFTAMSGTIVQLRLNVSPASGTQYVAGFAGHLTGMLSNCYVYGTITSPSGGNGFNTGVGTPLYVTKGTGWSAPGTTIQVQFNGYTVNSLGAL